MTRFRLRPTNEGFEIVAGARRYRASLLAEQFSIPSRIVELTDAQSLEWALVENAQRVDVHPYEEAQGFQQLLDIPGYDVAALVEKSGKSASHIYARLSLLQLIPEVAEAFTQERITASHTAIVENKRLGHTLAPIKAQQDSHFEVKIKTNSEKGEYQKRGRQIYGRPDYVPKIPTKPAAVAEPTARKT